MDQVKQMRTTLGGLPRQAQLAVMGIVVVTVLILMVVTRAATHTEWVTLSDGMQPATAAKAQKALDSGKIENRLGANATTLEVPKAQVSTAQAALAEAGISSSPGSHTGCDKAFGGDAKGSIMASTSSQHKIKLQTCLEGDIANKIEGLSGTGIQSATVTLVTAGNELFSSEETAARASITIDSGGEKLSNSQVRAVTSIATGAVKNLSAENVSIVDETGRLLSDPSEGNGTISEGQLKIKVEALYNQQLEAKLTHDFEGIAGVGNVKVISRAELDMDEIKREIKEFGGADNKQGPAAEEAIDTETLKGGGAAPGGTAGTATNVGTDPEAAARYAAANTGTGTTSDYLHDKSTKVYNNDAVAEAITVAPGRVLRDGLSVTVDSSVPDAVANAVKNSAQAVVGMDAQDSFNFDHVNIPEQADMTRDVAARERNTALMGYIKWAILGLGLIGMAFFLRRTLNERTHELMHPGEDILMLERGLDPVPLRELEAAVANATSFDNQKRHELQRKVETIATTKPSDVAQQLRGWLHESDYSGNRH